MSFFGESAGSDGDGLADHYESEIDDAADGQEGGVAEGCDFLLQRNRKDDANRHKNQDEFAVCGLHTQKMRLIKKENVEERWFWKKWLRQS